MSEHDPKNIGHVGLACYLWFNDHDIVSKHWQTRSLCTWEFNDDEAVRKDIDAFFQGKARVDPREYFPKVTEFKRKMYEDRP